MKKYIYNICLLAVLFVATTLVSCTNEDTAADNPPIVNTYTITVNATKGEDATTNRALALDGKMLNASWATTEDVYVKKGDAWATGTLKPQTAGTHTKLTGTLSGITINKDDNITLQFPSNTIDYTGQKGTLVDIAQRYDFATAPVTVTDVNGANITTTDATFENKQAIVKFTLKNRKNASLLANSLTLSATGLKTGETNTGDITITPVSATDEIYAAISGVSGVTLTLTANVGGVNYAYQKENLTFTHGRYYTVTAKLSPMANATSDDIGKVIGNDGFIYDTPLAASSAGTTALAMIAYVGNSSNCAHGLAIQLSNGGETSFTGAQTAAGKINAISGYKWRIPTREDWQNMFLACRISSDTSTAAQDMTVKGFRTKLAAIEAGIGMGTTLWTSTTDETKKIKAVFTSDIAMSFQPDNTGEGLAFRAVLAF